MRSRASVAENSAAGTNVGAAVTASANTNGYTLTHSLSGTDASKFDISSSTGQITVGTGTSLDYETKTSYSVVVTVKAAQAGVQSQSFTLDPNALRRLRRIRNHQRNGQERPAGVPGRDGFALRQRKLGVKEPTSARR